MIAVGSVADPERKAAIVRRILAALPGWFGIPDAIADKVDRQDKEDG